jgi:hypothetical protein
VGNFEVTALFDGYNDLFPISDTAQYGPYQRAEYVPLLK